MLLPRIKSRKVESQCRYGHAVFHLAHTHMGPCISPPTRTASLRGLLSSIKAHSMVLRNTYSLPQPWSFHLLLAMLVFETIAALTHHSTFTPSPCTTSTLFVQSSTLSLYYPPDEAISSLLSLSLPTNCHFSLSTMRPETAKKISHSHYPPFFLSKPSRRSQTPQIPFLPFQSTREKKSPLHPRNKLNPSQHPQWTGYPQHGCTPFGALQLS